MRLKKKKKEKSNQIKIAVSHRLGDAPGTGYGGSTP